MILDYAGFILCALVWTAFRVGSATKILDDEDVFIKGLGVAVSFMLCLMVSMMIGEKALTYELKRNYVTKHSLVRDGLLVYFCQSEEECSYSWDIDIQKEINDRRGLNEQ